MFFTQDKNRVFVGVSSMYDQWQAGFARRRYVGAKAVLLSLARGMFIVVVEPGFPDGDESAASVPAASSNSHHPINAGSLSKSTGCGGVTG